MVRRHGWLFALVVVLGAGAPAAPAGAAGGKIAELRDQLREAKADARKAEREARRDGKRASNRGQRLKQAKDTVGGGPGPLGDRLNELAGILGGEGTLIERASDLRAAAGNAATLVDENAALEDENSALMAEVAALKQQVANRDQQLANKDQQISDLTQDVADRDQQIADLNQEITNAEGLLGGAGDLVARATAVRNGVDPAAPSATVAVANVGAILGSVGDLRTSASMIQARIGVNGGSVMADLGSPTVNGIGNSLATLIGGSGSLAERLGDPITGTQGLASRIRNNDADLGTVNGFNASGFDNATSLSDQLDAFAAVLNQSQTVATTQIQIPKSAGFASLRSVLAGLNHD